jgi:hypothetical protein
MMCVVIGFLYDSDSKIFQILVFETKQLLNFKVVTCIETVCVL